VIAVLLGADRTTITRAISVARQLIEQHGITVEPAPARLYTLADLTAYAPPTASPKTRDQDSVLIICNS
jgi:biotin operon repressor